MTEGNNLVEQVSKNGDLITGVDNILSSLEIFEKLKTYFPEVNKDSDNMIIGSYKGFKYSIRIENITYLGNPHPFI